MRKFFALLVVLCMLPILGLAQGELITYDFGDFTMEFDSEIIGQIGEKVDGQVYFQLYPTYDETALFNSSMSCVWSATTFEVTAFEPAAYANLVLAQTQQLLESQNIVVTNPTVITAMLDEQDGRPAIAYIHSMDLDYTNAGYDLQMTLYTIQGVVPTEDIGVYAFTVSCDDLENADALLALMDTIKWN